MHSGIGLASNPASDFNFSGQQIVPVQHQQNRLVMKLHKSVGVVHIPTYRLRITALVCPYLFHPELVHYLYVYISWLLFHAKFKFFVVIIKQCFYRALQVCNMLALLIIVLHCSFRCFRGDLLASRRFGPIWWSRTFRRCRFVAAVSSRVHFVASHFVAGTLRRQPFRRRDTSSPAVLSRGHFVACRFVAGTLHRWSTKKTVEFSWAQRQRDEQCANRTYTLYMLG